MCFLHRSENQIDMAYFQQFIFFFILFYESVSVYLSYSIISTQHLAKQSLFDFPSFFFFFWFITHTVVYIPNMAAAESAPVVTAFHINSIYLLLLSKRSNGRNITEEIVDRYLYRRLEVNTEYYKYGIECVWYAFCM